MKIKQKSSRESMNIFGSTSIRMRSKLSKWVAHPLFSTSMFLFALGFVSVMVAASQNTTTYAAAAKCYATQETYQNTYDQDTAEIIRGQPTTQEIPCSQVTGITKKANKCYQKYELSDQHLDGSSANKQVTWSKEIDCTQAQKCADDHGGIAVRATPKRGGVTFAVSDAEVAWSDDYCPATQAEINSHCPDCISPDDIPQDSQDYAGGDSDATKYCKDKKGYTDLLLQACEAGYGDDDCKLINSGNPSAQEKKEYNACADGRSGAGLSPPPGNSTCKTVILNVGCDGDSVKKLLGLFLDIMTAGVGIAAVGGIAYGAFMYTTAGGSSDRVQKAKSFIANVVIGIIAYICLYAFLQFLIPGGAF